VRDAVTASRTVVKDVLFHAFGSAKNLLHFIVLVGPCRRPSSGGRSGG
jgi:hypothetical protein